jgi:hypothetical protein
LQLLSLRLSLFPPIKKPPASGWLLVSVNFGVGVGVGPCFWLGVWFCCCF